jgi:hypothetical protein
MEHSGFSSSGDGRVEAGETPTLQAAPVGSRQEFCLAAVLEKGRIESR